MRNTLETCTVVTVLLTVASSTLGLVPFKGYNADFSRFYSGYYGGVYHYVFYDRLGSVNLQCVLRSVL